MYFRFFHTENVIFRTELIPNIRYTNDKTYAVNGTEQIGRTLKMELHLFVAPIFLILISEFESAASACFSYPLASGRTCHCMISENFLYTPRMCSNGRPHGCGNRGESANERINVGRRRAWKTKRDSVIESRSSEWNNYDVFIIYIWYSPVGAVALRAWLKCKCLAVVEPTRTTTFPMRIHPWIYSIQRAVSAHT